MNHLLPETKNNYAINFEEFNLEEEIKKTEGYYPTPGWHLLVRLYIEPLKLKSEDKDRDLKRTNQGDYITSGGIVLPKATEAIQEKVIHDLYDSFSGVVLKMSKNAYNDERYKMCGKWCEVGDWVTFPRTSTFPLEYNGIPLVVINEDSIKGTFDDPRKIKPLDYNKLK